MSHEPTKHDDLLLQLRALPVPTLDAVFSERVRREAIAELSRPAPSVSSLARVRGWLDLVVGRVFLPISLAGATASYLFWALNAASQIYR